MSLPHILIILFCGIVGTILFTFADYKANKQYYDLPSFIIMGIFGGFSGLVIGMIIANLLAMAFGF
jgi:hypothetical protein